MATRTQMRQAEQHLCRADSVLAATITRVGPCQLRPQRDRFRMLVRSITSQQISVKAAQSINARLEQLAAPDPLSPAAILRAGPEGLRSCGVSPQKARYLQDLANKIESKDLQLERIGRFRDEQVIEQLVIVTGIGRWTAHMFLIFALGRMDVLPVDDLGVRSAMRQLYGLDALPDREQCERLAAPWRPYASIASWYCWRSLEASRGTGKAKS